MVNLFTKKPAIKTLVILLIFFFISLFNGSLWSAESDYHGIYSGTYESSLTNGDNGYWIAYFGANLGPYDNSDMIWLAYSTESDMGDAGYGDFILENTDSISFNAWNLDYDVSAYGTIATGGSTTGTWDNSWDVDSGTFSGSRVTSCPQAGNYSGTISGDSSGSWTMVIQNNGYISGTATIEDGTTPYEGGINPGTGYFTAVGHPNTYTDVTVYGQVSGGSVSGGWYDSEGNSGAVSGSNGSGGDSGSGDGGGGGGCFISAIK